MKVEFTVEEAWEMMNSVVDQLAALDLPDADTAALRRWRSREMTPTSPQMRLLTEKINAELARAHQRAEVSAIQKPDWA